VLHHVGVLYHLTDPVDHLYRFCDLTRRAVMLDTHVAPASEALEPMLHALTGPTWPAEAVLRHRRHADHAKWLRRKRIVAIYTRRLHIDGGDASRRRTQRHAHPPLCGTRFDRLDDGYRFRCVTKLRDDGGKVGTSIESGQGGGIRWQSSM
jgi:hypothetical protein